MSGGPRNRALFESGQRVRAAIHDIMLRHAHANPLAPPLPAKLVVALLPPSLRRSESEINYHVRAIRRASTAKGRCRTDLFGPENAEPYTEQRNENCAERDSDGI